MTTLTWISVWLISLCVAAVIGYRFAPSKRQAKEAIENELWSSIHGGARSGTIERFVAGVNDRIDGGLGGSNADWRAHWENRKAAGVSQCGDIAPDAVAVEGRTPDEVKP